MNKKTKHLKGFSKLAILKTRDNQEYFRFILPQTATTFHLAVVKTIFETR